MGSEALSHIFKDNFPAAFAANLGMNKGNNNGKVFEKWYDEQAADLKGREIVDKFIKSLGRVKYKQMKEIDLQKSLPPDWNKE